MPLDTRVARCFLAAAFIGLLGNAVAEPVFRFECLPRADKLRPYAANSINASGMIAGRGDGGNNYSKCFRYANGVVSELNDNLDSTCVSINDSGDIAGTDNLPDSHENATVWLMNGERLQVRANTWATAINNAGQLAVHTNRESGPHAGFLYTRHTRTPLGTSGGEETVTSALNDAGVVVGRSQDATGAWKAYEWQAGVMREVCQRTGALATRAVDIGATGRRLCAADLPTGSVAFIEEPDGSQRDLPPLKSGYWEPEAMNESGWVVGASRNRPVLFDGERAHRLDRLGDADSAGIDFEEAEDINDDGLIVGSGNKPGTGKCALLATPQNAAMR